MTIRPATGQDLPVVDGLIRTTAVEASPLSVADYPDNFVATTRPMDLLVAVIDERSSANAHVLMVAGVGVDPARQGAGVGRGLVLAAVREATTRGARRLTLCVLGRNALARALYESLGFVVEGVLRAKFLLDGEYVDDVLMARTLVAP
jgi:RimJ/RimL family protein N-acetyltransferase